MAFRAPARRQRWGSLGFLIAAGVWWAVSLREPRQSGVALQVPVLPQRRLAPLAGSSRHLAQAPSRGLWLAPPGSVARRAAAEAEAEGEDVGSEAEDLDWRDFRARLVQQEAQKREGVATAEATAGGGGGGDEDESGGEQSDGWAYATPIIEQGSLLLSAPGDHFAINQQYFHKTVIFIVDHSPNFTKGVILNRPTAFSTGDLRDTLQISDADPLLNSSTDAWNVWCGGDCQGLNSRRTIFDGGVDYCCLHTVERLRPFSNEIIKGAFVIALPEAQRLVEEGEADKDDFLLLVGYCGWGPGQLQRELDRGDSWTLAAADRRQVLGRLREEQASLTQRLEAAIAAPGLDAAAPGAPLARPTAREVGDGIAEWSRLYRALGPRFVEELKNDTETHTDEMLRRWVDACLIPPRYKPSERKQDSDNDFDLLETGTLLRASAKDWVLGKPGYRMRMDTLTADGVPCQYLHKAVLMLAKDYVPRSKDYALVILLNGPPVGRVEDKDRREVYFGGASSVGGNGNVFEVKGPEPQMLQGMVVVLPQVLEELIDAGALEVVEDVDLQEVLSVPRGERWTAAGGRIETLADAVEARLGDVQKKMWYKRFLGLDLDMVE
mmetsp:Transcript_99593/g.260171  ORF Transcript_99593/g.260171 Transcript_99593/m.260171 type:complete len:608 (-) Transcript_99593:20-1843(-)